MKKIQLLFLFVLIMTTNSFTQTRETKEIKSFLQKGQFSLGMRTSTSFFGHDKIPAMGVGGQMRLQILNFINTEWFADWTTIDLKGAGTRSNAHIGWSVMFYPRQTGKIIPYALAGHCFDYAKVRPLSTPYLDRSSDMVSRWSSAIQIGLGSHFFISDRFDVSLSAQYMLHLGDHLNYELIETNTTYYLETNTSLHEGPDIEGHLLITASMNFVIGDLW